MSVVQNAKPIGGVAGLVFGSAPYTLKWRGSPPSGENATAAGNSCLSSASGFGFVMMRCASRMAAPELHRIAAIAHRRRITGEDYGTVAVSCSVCDDS